MRLGMTLTPLVTGMVARLVNTCLLVSCLLATRIRAAESIALNRPEATFFAGSPANFAHVIDGVETGPQGWSVAPKVHEPQALVVRCARSVEAAELDVTLFFLAGRPMNTIAEFALSYTTDPEPSLSGNWKPLEVVRFNAQVTTLRRTEDGRLRSDPLPFQVTGTIPDDVYRATVLLPGGRATGFRLEVFPVKRTPKSPPGLSWYPGFNFWLTEFRVAVHTRETTNIALHRPVKSSHTLFVLDSGESQQAGALTDGLPATIAHPDDPTLGANFYFEVDLGRVAALDHIGLRNRGDLGFERLSRVWLRLYEDDPSGGAAPVWKGMNRADGSHPAEATVDIVHPDIGKGTFRGRYLRLSSDSPVPNSPQLAEVEVYESRTPEVVSVLADGREIPVTERLDLPPGVRRLALRLRIPQTGMPPGVKFRWRLLGDLEAWQDSRLMTIDMACPVPGKSVFEAQALHSDGQWDATIYRLPIHTGCFFWETPAFRWLAGISGLLAALGLGLFVARRRAKRQLDRLRLETALANERARIAQDLHDDLGAELSSIAMLADLERQDLPPERAATSRLNEITSHAKHTVRRLEEIVWAVNPANDTLEGFAGFFCKFAQGYLELAGVASRFDLPDLFPGHSLSTVRRHHLFLAAKEAVHNAVRHGSPTEVTIRMQLSVAVFHLIIEDNGRGFDDSQDRSDAAHGSANMSRRMKAIGGTFARDSHPGKGTVVTFSIPLGKSAT